MKYKIIVVVDKDLVSTLESQAKQGFEPCHWLSTEEPGRYSDDRSFKILMRSFNKK